MSIYQYLQLQPVDPQDDGSVSVLDDYTPDEQIDLSSDTPGEELVQEWEAIEREMHDDATDTDVS